MPEKKPPPKTKIKDIKEHDRALWDAAIADVTRIPQKTGKAHISAAPKSHRVKPRHIPHVPVKGLISLEVASPCTSQSSFQLDSALRKRFERGELDLDGKIDLHGMTLEQAHKRFRAFVVAKINVHARFLLIITGKGAGGEGIIRKNLGLWCEDSALRPYILCKAPAAAKHGGSGATYLLLRRVRPEA